MKQGAKIAGMNGPLRSPMAGPGLVNKPKLHPSIGANTTIPGTAPNAAPIQSPQNGQVNIGRKK